MSDERKPWETPIQYNDWFAEPEQWAGVPDDEQEFDDPEEGIESSDFDMDDEIADQDEGADFASNDDEPLDYSRGPHSDEFGVADDDELED